MKIRKHSESHLMNSRIHGGLSTGVPKGAKNGNYVDGTFTAEAIEDRRWAKELVVLYTKAIDE